MASTTTHYEYLGNNTYTYIQRIERQHTYNIEQNKNLILYRKERWRDIHEK